MMVKNFEKMHVILATIDLLRPLYYEECKKNNNSDFCRLFLSLTDHARLLIDKIGDSHDRMRFMLHCVDGLSWDEADTLLGEQRKDSIK